MNEKINDLAEKMSVMRNTKLFDAFVKTTSQAFVLVFMVSGVLFINSLLPQTLKITQFLDAISKVYALLPLLIAYYFGCNIKDKTLGIISLITVALYSYGAYDNASIILAFIYPLIISVIQIVIEYALDSLKLPQVIPSMAKDTFITWLKNILTLFAALIIMAFTTKLTFLNTLAAGIVSVGTSPIFYFAIIILSGLFWTIGLHGDRLTGPFFESFIFIALFQNLVSSNPQNIINSSFHVVFASGSGSGITMGLILAILLISKRKEEKIIAKENIVSGMFNINEGVVFGLPIVDSKRYIMPFMIAPVVSALFGYLMTYFGVIKPFIYTIPWVTPPLLKSYIASGGQWMPVLVEFMSYCLCVLVYLPFVIKANKENDDAH